MLQKWKALVGSNKGKTSGHLRGYMENGEQFLDSKTVDYLRAESHELIIGSQQLDDNFDQNWVAFSLPNDLPENQPNHVVLLHHNSLEWAFHIKDTYYKVDEGSVTFSYKPGKGGVFGKFDFTSGATKVRGDFDIWNK
ncbi:hypothetical protein EMIT0347P_10558 [Pseudomonas sp. IT-347P]|uniref:hypothetical protein n=1 Tax=Pseudomonas sp. IT-347P TaxID=3026458 RepID=UPI0039E1C5DC